MPSTWVKSASSTWTKIASLFVKTSSAWSDMASAWVKTGSSSWTKVFSKAFVPTIAQQVLITLATANSTTQTKKITGTLYRWTNSTSVSYRFRKSTDNINYSNISGASGTSTNPAAGTSNTNDTYTLTQSDLTANTTNYFQYVSTASNSTYGTSAESVSYETSFEMPRDLSLSATSTGSTITLTWTNDTTGSNNYEYQYKLTSGSTWSTAAYTSPGSGSTSVQFTGLSFSTSYDFRVRGWTGTTNGSGYYGNYATLTKSTTGPQAPNSPTGLYGDAIGTTDFFLGWTSSAVDATHDAAESYDYGVSAINGIAPSTEITSGNPSPGQYRNKLIANTNNYELIGGLSPNTNYYGYVRAKNSGGTSSWAVSTAIKTLALKPPNNITGLTHDSASATKTSLKFNFTAPTTDSTHDAALTYAYSYNTTNTAPSGNGDYETLDSTASITIGGSFNPLSANTTYYIFIKAKNNDGLSSSWVSTSGKTLQDLNPPTQATSLSVTNRSPSGFSFSWTPNGGTATSFKVAYNQTGTTPTTDGFTEGTWYDTASTSTSFRFQGLSAGTTYYAYVKGYNADGEATSARSATITTLAAPSISNPSWASTNFQRSTYSQYTTQKSRTTSVITVYKDDSGTNTSNPGNLATQYSTTNNTSVTLAALGTGYDGTRTVSGAFSNRITASVTNSTSQALTSDTDGTITGNTRLRWGFDDGTETHSGTGTYAAITMGGVEYEIYDAATGGTLLASSNYSYDFTLDTPTVNGTSYYHVYLSGRDGIDNHANPRYMRIRTYATDYDGKYWYSSWSGRI
jgi:hypothetical protein